VASQSGSQVLFTLFLSCPSDVAPERAAVKRVVEELNRSPFLLGRCSVRLLAYEDCVPSKMGPPAQEVVDEFMGQAGAADLYLGIFCHRLGTPYTSSTGKSYESGTHYELDCAFQTWRDTKGVQPAILFFRGNRDFPGQASEEAFEQYHRLRKFLTRFTGDPPEYPGLWKSYRDLAEFERLVREDLLAHVNRLLNGASDEPEPPPQLLDRRCLRSYLRWLVHRHEWLDLPIPEAGTLQIPLEQVYVALKGQPEREYEWRQAQSLHETEVKEAAGVGAFDMIPPQTLADLEAANVRQTYRPQKEAEKQARLTDVRNLADAFRTHRRLVILGGPGSGKSTLGRWLTLQFARVLLRHIDEGQLDELKPGPVRVAASQVDPLAARDAEEVHLGPARLPILVRIADYARHLVRSPDAPLDSFLGADPAYEHLFENNGEKVESEPLNTLLRAALARQFAVVILDGLDELTETNRRNVVLKVQEFIADYIPPLPGMDRLPDPWEAGCNQVLGTSRYVGYRTAPIRAGATHFGIEPMSREAVEVFARSWSASVNKAREEGGKSRVSGDALIREIYNPGRPAIRQLARNPLLVTILAAVYCADGKLPDQRAALYDRVIRNLLRIWLKRKECKDRELTDEHLLAALEPLAAEMHDADTASGLISLKRFSEVVKVPLARMCGMDPEERRFKVILEALLSTVRSQVGLLAEQGPGNYAFFHRTFQEFLAARHLLAEPDAALGKLLDRLDHPLWREPLVLALGHALSSPDWSSRREQLLRALLASDDSARGSLPAAALLFLSALSDLPAPPRDVVKDAVHRLLLAFSVRHGQQEYEPLQTPIQRAFAAVKRGQHAAVVARILEEMLAGLATDREVRLAAAEVLRRTNWFTTELVEALFAAAPYDSPDRGWPINQALGVALGHRPENARWLPAAAVLDHNRLGHRLRLRRFLEANPQVVEWVKTDFTWTRLLTALYGGLGDRQLTGRLERLVVQRVRDAREYPLDQFVPDWEVEAVKLASQALPEFDPRDITSEAADTGFTRRIQELLKEHKSARLLSGFCRHTWETARDPAVRAEAVLVLAALGEDVLGLLEAIRSDDQQQPTRRAIIDRLDRLDASLSDPIARARAGLLDVLPQDIPEHHRIDLLSAAIAVCAGTVGGPLQVSGSVPGCESSAGPEQRRLLDAEHLVYLASGTWSDEWRHDVAVFLDEHADHLSGDLAGFIASFGQVHRARNLLAQPRIDWCLPLLPPRPEGQREELFAMLDVLEGYPKQIGFFAGWALERCRGCFQQHSLVVEMLALVLPPRQSFLECSPVLAEGTDLELCNAPDRLLDAARRIGEPYTRFRALWRLARWDSAEPNREVIREAVAAAGAIAHPHDFVRAWEHIATLLPEEVDESRWRSIIDNVHKIADTENRSRALARLALRAKQHSAQRREFFAAAVQAAAGIDDNARLAAILGELHRAFRADPESLARLRGLAETIPPGWERFKGLERLSRLVLEHQEECGARSPAVWSALYLKMVIDEARQALGSLPRLSPDWTGLLGEQRPAALDALVRVAAFDGLPVEGQAVGVVESAAQPDGGESLAELWPLLERPDTVALAATSRWAERMPNGPAASWSALLQVEAGRLSRETVAPVIDLLDAPNDRLRYRAMLALHSPDPHSGKKDRRWSIRRVGPELFAMVNQAALDRRFDRPQQANVLSWVDHDVHHDDPEAIARWVVAASSGSEEEQAVAERILGRIESVDERALDVLLFSLGTNNPRLLNAVLRSLARLAYSTPTTLVGRWEEIFCAVRAVPGAVRRSWRVLPAGPAAVLAIAAEAIEATGGAEPSPKDAAQIVEGHLRFLDEESLASPETLQERLLFLGQQLLVGREFWSRPGWMAKPLAEKEPVLLFLLAWLELETAQDPSSDRVRDLVCALFVLTHGCRDAFADRATPESWEPMLCDLVAQHPAWVCRLAAVGLLGRLRRVTPRMASALRAAARDIAYVQEVACEVAGDLRTMQGEVVLEVLTGLDDPSAAAAAMTANLLASLARGEGTSASDRRRILQGLHAAVRRPSARRQVYYLEYDDGFAMRYAGRLEELLNRAIVNTSGG
jgi:hypothetical protein